MGASWPRRAGSLARRVRTCSDGFCPRPARVPWAAWRWLVISGTPPQGGLRWSTSASLGAPSSRRTRPGPQGAPAPPPARSFGLVERLGPEGAGLPVLPRPSVPGARTGPGPCPATGRRGHGAMGSRGGGAAGRRRGSAAGAGPADEAPVRRSAGPRWCASASCRCDAGWQRGAGRAGGGGRGPGRWCWTSCPWSDRGAAGADTAPLRLPRHRACRVTAVSSRERIGVRVPITARGVRVPVGAGPGRRPDARASAHPLCSARGAFVGTAPGRGAPDPRPHPARRDQSPVAPSIRSRIRSAWPLWRAYSSIMCR